MTTETTDSIRLPRGCTFPASDWQALAPFRFPVAFSHEVQDRPFPARLLDERLVISRLGDGSIHAARDLGLHRGEPLSADFIEGDPLVCGYLGFRYDGCGQCVGIPAHPGAAIPPKLKLNV